MIFRPKRREQRALLDVEVLLTCLESSIRCEEGRHCEKSGNPAADGLGDLWFDSAIGRYREKKQNEPNEDDQASGESKPSSPEPSAESHGHAFAQAPQLPSEGNGRSRCGVTLR